jgi:hypothetical protein
MFRWTVVEVLELVFFYGAIAGVIVALCGGGAPTDFDGVPAW